MDGVLQMEDSIFGFPEVNLEHLSLKEQVDLTRLLRAKDYFFAHESQILESFERALILIFSHIAGLLPKTLAPSPFVIPLAFALPNPTLLIENLYGTLWQDEYKSNGLFVNLTRQMYFNLCEVSGIPIPEEPKKPFLHATKNKEPLSAIIDGYLKHTPFQEFFNAPLPLQLTHEERFSHMHIIGGSGAGKTQLLQNLILHDLTSEKRPALVIVDSQGDLIHKILRLDLDYEPILISPKDIHNPPALNIFDVKRLGNYDEASREQVTAGVIQTFDYLFEGLIGADLTAKQDVFFRFVARLMLALPETMGRNATILDMLALMDDVTPYVATIAKLPPIQRQFFERDFPSKNFAQTKEQIRYRLQAILENPTLARLFSSPETKIDLFTELNKGSVILVDTAKDFLKGASAHFGRIFISLVLQAVLERAVIPEHKRTHAFLMVDEAAQYFDSNIDDLLTEARKYKLGCVFAHQFLEQCTPSLRASLAANTAIKMAGGVSTGDARAMAPEMRTTPDFILGQPKLHFACHIRNVTPQAVSIPVKAGELERHPKLSADDYDLLMARNRERVSSSLHTNERKSEPNSSPDPGTGASSDW
ncbi:MAG: hypothetical protein B7Z80_03210 [Rhodospirillales bacterium 20-64-7]|nr:MAG: hypothetical protein B7Z80_03210 [Rhodospirillales bacterium 20-64-7]